jgi:pimeloyl-ACP methyl ester carboxylesterase
MGGAVVMQYALTHPDRVRSLLTYPSMPAELAHLAIPNRDAWLDAVQAHLKQ